MFLADQAPIADFMSITALLCSDSRNGEAIYDHLTFHFTSRSLYTIIVFESETALLWGDAMPC